MADAAPLSPSIFLSPQITADLDTSLDAIEEFLLYGDTDDYSAASASAALSSPIAWSGILDATTSPATTGGSGYVVASTNNQFITNAVHMQLQENAKLPTFNLPVDRSNTSWHLPAPRGRRSTMNATRRQHQRFSSIDSFNSSKCPLSPTSNLMGQFHQNVEEEQNVEAAAYHAIDEMLRLNEHDFDFSMNDVKLCEYFLDGEDSSSAALAYSVAPGGMSQCPMNTTVQNVSISACMQSSVIPHLGNNAANLPYTRVRPLPIPELKTSHPPFTNKDISNLDEVKDATEGSTANVASTPAEIETSLDSPTDSQHIAQTMIGVCPLAKFDPLSRDPLCSSLSKTSCTSFAPSAIQSKNTVAKPPLQPFPSQHEATSRQSLHAVTHSQTNASIRYATGQRSKFGFGENHAVPSVPAPPFHLVKTHSCVDKAKPKSILPSKRAINSKATSIALTSVSPAQSGPQYERKKQRAKDARVKLNKSMEELALAIDLAGSQSKMRFDYMVKTMNCKNPHVTPSNGSTTTNILPQHPLATVMDLTIQQAASAKKWDRPSFVGLSASIISSLNAQCEGLMREVAQLRSIVRINGSIRSPQSCTPHKTGDGSNSPHIGTCSDEVDIAVKKQKLDSTNDANFTSIAEAQLCMEMASREQQRCDAIHHTVGTPSLLQNIASFLDPTSLCKCLCVSKGWRTQHIFQNNDLWLHLCNKRYGSAIVRKWRDKDTDGVISHCTAESEVGNALKMYRNMSMNNVKPNCPMEGTIFLGGSTSDKLVNCWISLIDRSNGETSRSVMQEKIQDRKTQQYYVPSPVVELRLLVQNTGYANGNIVIPHQQFAVDASTRRTGEKMLEIYGDHRFKSRVLHFYGNDASKPSPDTGRKDEKPIHHDFCSLRLFESAILSVHIHAKGCPTISKFRHRSKRIQLLVSIGGVIKQLVIPFHCMNEHNLKQIL